MKEKYEVPELTIIELHIEDTITTSGPGLNTNDSYDISTPPGTGSVDWGGLF